MKIKLSFFEELKKYKFSSVKKKIFITLFILFLYRLGNNIPLGNIDQSALTRSTNSFNPFEDPILLYTNDNSKFVSFFFLGIGPYINASFLIDLLTPIFFENFLEEEGSEGQKKLLLLKKILCGIFASIQAYIFLNKIQSFFYVQTTFEFYLALIQLTAASLFVVWLTNCIDNYGIGKGTSLIVLLNILISGFESIKVLFFSPKNFSLDYFWLIPLILVLFSLNRSTKIIKITNAKQSEYLKNNTIKTSSSNFLKLKLNRAGILPLIISSNIFGLITAYFRIEKNLSDVIYYLLIFFCTCFYNSISFDCEKVSENFRKQSVVIIDNNEVISPGKKTAKFLENKLFLISIIYSVSIISLFFSINWLKEVSRNSLFFEQINFIPLLLASNILSEFGETFRYLYYEGKIEKVNEKLKKKN
jgi:preprotein translocase subunit SecY